MCFTNRNISNHMNNQTVPKVYGPRSEGAVFQKPNRNNWALWKFDIKQLLLSNNVYDVAEIESGELSPKSKSKWNQKNSKAFSLIYLHRNDGMKHHLRTLEGFNAKESLKN